MILDLPKLRIFAAVARASSFTRAADDLDLRQPTVSQQIQVLERGLRTPLFERMGRRVQLTPAGEALLPYAERLLALAGEAETATREAAGLAARTLRLGVGNTLATYILPDLLARLRWERPDVIVQVQVGNTEQLIAAVVDHRVELALVGAPLSHPLLAIHAFLRDALVVIVPPDDEWAERRAIGLGELQSRPLLQREEGSALQASVNELLRDHGIVPERTITLGNLEAIKRSVEAGLGVAIVPELAVRREVRADMLRALPFGDVQLRRVFNYIHQRDRNPTPAAQVFIDLLHKPFE
ncbi:MAG: LysR family transcriptional regulator [Chloroflexota bacterium]|nr:LysR family transcriptional regulator [Chloroflexota bacterium]PLS78385.1 MAG: LysR family transcriptional regulator [Chloroflexota bacterium]